MHTYALHGIQVRSIFDEGGLSIELKQISRRKSMKTFHYKSDITIGERHKKQIEEYWIRKF